MIKFLSVLIIVLSTVLNSVLASADGEKMRFQIQIYGEARLLGETGLYNIEVDRKGTVNDLRKAIRSVTSIPPHMQTLSIHGRFFFSSENSLSWVFEGRDAPVFVLVTLRYRTDLSETEREEYFKEYNQDYVEICPTDKNMIKFKNSAAKAARALGAATDILHLESRDDIIKNNQVDIETIKAKYAAFMAALAESGATAGGAGE